MKEGIELGNTRQNPYGRDLGPEGAGRPLSSPGSGPGRLQATPQECACSRSHGNVQASSAFRWRKEVVGEAGASPWEVPTCHPEDARGNPGCLPPLFGAPKLLETRPHVSSPPRSSVSASVKWKQCYWFQIPPRAISRVTIPARPLSWLDMRGVGVSGLVTPATPPHPQARSPWPSLGPSS